MMTRDIERVERNRKFEMRENFLHSVDWGNCKYHLRWDVWTGMNGYEYEFLLCIAHRL